MNERAELLKAFIVNMIPCVRLSRNPNDARLINAASVELYNLTGEVYSCGKFIKV